MRTPVKVSEEEKLVIPAEQLSLFLAFKAGWNAHEHTNLPAPYEGNKYIPAAFREWIGKVKIEEA